MRLVLFNRDLRVIDNTALVEAIDGQIPVVAAFIATPKQWESHSLSPIQADLIQRRLHVLKGELEQLNVPFIYHEAHDYVDANQWLVTVAQQLGINQVFVNRDYEVNEAWRLQQLAKLGEGKWSVESLMINAF